MAINFPEGTQSLPSKIVQVVQTVKTGTYTSSNSSGTFEVTGMNASITPKASSSKILIIFSLNCDNQKDNDGGGFRIYRNGAHLTGATAPSAGSRYIVNTTFGANANRDQSGMNKNFMILDSPNTTSSRTYSLYIHKVSGDRWYLNRSQVDANQSDDPRMISTVTLMEVAA
jgi:hypothetical protein